MNVFNHLQKDKQRKQRHSLKLGKKRREISKRNYYIISPRVLIKAIIITKRQSWGYRTIVESGWQTENPNPRSPESLEDGHSCCIVLIRFVFLKLVNPLLVLRHYEHLCLCLI